MAVEEYITWKMYWTSRPPVMDYGSGHTRLVAAREAPHAVKTMAALRRAAIGRAAAGSWSFILVGALPPADETAEVFLASLGQTLVSFEPFLDALKAICRWTVGIESGI